MTRPRSSKTSGKGRSTLVLGWVDSGTMKMPPKINYGKYRERYQYITRFFSGCHGARLAPLGGLSTNDHRNRIRSDGKAAFPKCENLLRNDLVMQQVCAC